MQCYTIYNARNRARHLIETLDCEPGLEVFRSCLSNLEEEFLNKTLEPPFDAVVIQKYKQTARKVYDQFYFLLKQSHRLQLEFICLVLMLLAQKMEFLSESNNISLFQEKLIPLANDSEQFGTTMTRLLSQQNSVYLAGHKGICAPAAKEWLADNFMCDAQSQAQNVIENFVKAVEFKKEELSFLYAREEKNIKNALTFCFITGFVRLSNGAMLLSLLARLSENKDTYYFINFVHFRNRLSHAVGCKFIQNRIEWFDSDCGIFQSQHKERFGHWLDFYLETNHYKDKFSFFTVSVGERAPRAMNSLLNGDKFIRNIFG